MPSINYPANYVKLSEADTEDKRIFIGGIGTDCAELDKSGLFFSYNDRCVLEFFCIMSKSRTHHLNFRRNCEITEKFPFYEFLTDNGDYSVRTTIWNPLIFNDDVDSSIPAAFFDFEITNTGSGDLAMTFAAKLTSPFEKCLCAEEESKDSVRVCSIFDTAEAHSISISSNDKNTIITFFESYALAGVPVRLSSGEKKRVRFILSWYKKAEGLENYYTRYFDSSRECANYSFAHMKRLFDESNQVCDLIYRSTFSEDVKKLFTEKLEAVKSKETTRDTAGFIKCDNVSAVPFISHFFPRLDKKLALKRVIRSGKLESDDAFTRLLSLYRALRFGDDSSFIENNWDEILDFIEFNFNSFTLPEDNTLLSHAIIYSLSKITRDRKLGEKHKDGISSINTFYNKTLQSYSDAYNKYREIMGLDFDIFGKKIKLSPDMNQSDNGVFVGILSFDGFIGYVERGIDYLQINCIKGRLTLREIEAPKIPLKITCANINIGFTKNGNSAYLDNDCDVVPGRSIVVIFNS